MSSEKTLGQTEWEARNAFYVKKGWGPALNITWDDLSADQKEAQEVGASAVRLAVIEECAKALEDLDPCAVAGFRRRMKQSA